MADEPRAAVAGKWGGVCPRCGKFIATIAVKSKTGESVCCICAYAEEVRG